MRVQALFVRLLDLVLDPGAPYVLETLRQDIATIVIGLRSASFEHAAPVNDFAGLDELALAIERNGGSVAAFVALRNALNHVDGLRPNSAAQLFIWLRHFIQFATDDFGLDEISEVVGSNRVSILLSRARLFPNIRLRLRTVYLTSNGMKALAALRHGTVVMNIQRKLQSPIALAAMSDAKRERDLAVHVISSVIRDFELLEVEIRAAELSNDLWSCCLERGGLRRLTGAILVELADDPNAREIWLRPSINDFQRAADAARPLNSAVQCELAVKAAVSGTTVARFLNDEIATAEFSQVLTEVRGIGDFEELIASQEALEATDVLNNPKDSAAPRYILKTNDETGIQHYTDLMMAAGGWPPSNTRAMLTWSIIANACRSASKRAIIWRLSSPTLISLTATLRWTGWDCSAK